MAKLTWSSLATLAVLASLAVLITAPRRSPQAWAQEDRDEQREEREREEDVDPEHLERRLDEIETLLERAERAGNEERIRELRQEAERLFDQLEQFERAREDDEEFGERFEHEIRELEIHRLHLEIDRLHQDTQRAQQESAIRMANIAQHKSLAAVYALNQALERLDEEEAIEFLSELPREALQPTTIRIVELHLARLKWQMDRPDEALKQLRQLIIND